MSCKCAIGGQVAHAARRTLLIGRGSRPDFSAISRSCSMMKACAGLSFLDRRAIRPARAGWSAESRPHRSRRKTHILFGVSAWFLRHDGLPQKENVDEVRRHSGSMQKLPRLQVRGSGFSAARIDLHINRKLLAFVEIVHTSTFDYRDVNEHIRVAAVPHDEAIALLGIEELNGPMAITASL
jgi:hypothetical protein